MPLPLHASVLLSVKWDNSSIYRSGPREGSQESQGGLSVACFEAMSALCQDVAVLFTSVYCDVKQIHKVLGSSAGI